jgi:hypothetical protein
LAQNYKDMTENLVDLNREARKVGIKINKEKTKEMLINNNNRNTFTLGGKEIENVHQFPYLDSIVTMEDGSMEAARNEISNVYRAFIQPQKFQNQVILR